MFKEKRFGCQASKQIGYELMVRVCVGECMGHSLEHEPLTLTKYHSYMMPEKGGSPSVAEPAT